MNTLKPTTADTYKTGIYNEDALRHHLKGHRLTAEEIITKMKKSAIEDEALSKVKSYDLNMIYSLNEDVYSMITDAYLLGFYKGRNTK